MKDIFIKDSGEKTWLTPRYILDPLGHFDTDPCCPKNMPWKTADKMLTKEEDGTVYPWSGRVWLNPPYGRDGIPFLDRMSKHEAGGIALVFARTNTAWWHQLIFPVAHSILFLRGQIRFCKPDGVPGKFWAVSPSALISYSPFDSSILEDSGLDGYLVYMKGGLA